MFSTANKTNQTPAVQQKSAATTFFRKAGGEGFFGTKDSDAFFKPSIQPKLTVSSPDDPQEKEADAVADKVTRMPEPVAAAPVVDKKEEKLRLKEEEELQAKGEQPVPEKIQCKAEPEEKLQPKLGANGVTRRHSNAVILSRKQIACNQIINQRGISLHRSDILRQSGRGPPTDPIPFEQTLASSKGGGSALRGDTQQFMESRFNADFSGVRIHTDARAEALSSSVQAQAFAHGNDIYFNSGKFSPDSAGGRVLLAHELTHTIQQGASKSLARSPYGLMARKESLRRTDPGLTANKPAFGINKKEASPGRPRTKPANELSPWHVHPGGSLQRVVASSTAVPATSHLNEESPSSKEGGVQKKEQLPALHIHDLPGTNIQRLSLGQPGFKMASSMPIQAWNQPDSFSSNHSRPGTNVASQRSFSFDKGLDIGRISLPVEKASGTLGIDRIQRSEGDEDSGIFAGIRRRFNGVVDGLRSGWSSLSGLAQSAFDDLRGQFTSITQGLGTLVSSALSGIQSGWESLSQMATQLTNGIQQVLQGAIGTIMGAVRAITQSIIKLDAAGLQAAFGRLNGLIGGVFQRLQQAGQAVIERVTGLWNGLQDRFNGVVASITERATQILGQLQSAATTIRTRITSAWESLQGKASQMSGVVGGVLAALRSLVDQLLSWGQQIWSGIQQQFSSLWTRLESFTQGIKDQFDVLWQRLRQQATNLWNQLTELWNRLRQWVMQQVERLTARLRSIWNSFLGISIADLVAKITGFAQVLRLANMIATGLRGMIEPIAQKVTAKVYAAMPGPALGFAQKQLGRIGGAEEPAAPAKSSQPPGDVHIQRQPLAAAVPLRSTTGYTDIKNGFLAAIRNMWSQLNPGSFLNMVLNVLLEQLIPIIAVVREIKAFFVEDMANLVNSLFMPRNIFSDPLGALHDIYTNLLHLVMDFALSLVRRIINILMAFMLWITIILTLIGFVGGAVAVGILGGVLGFLGGLGIGAGPGAAGGAAAGGAAGAGVGFGVAALINETIFFAFLAAHAVTIVELLLDLSTTLQTDEEKKRDYKQLAESAVAVGVGLALLGLAWLAGLVAKGVSALLKFLKVQIPLPGFLRRFLEGIGLVKKRKPGDPPVDPAAAALAARQRLAPLIGDSLAVRLITELGPGAAEALVARLGAKNVVRLATELNPRAIQLIAASLEAAVVDRLLNGGFSPTRISATVAAGQAARLAALTTEQITRLAALSDTGFTRIIRLPEAQFQRFVNLAPAQLRAFAEMEQAAFNRFAALSNDAFAKFSTMAPERLQVYANLGNDAFNRFAALDAATFAKFDRLSPEALARFGAISDPAFARFAALPPDALAKFSNVPTPALERFGTMDPARFTIFSQAEQATIEKFAALSDAVFNRYGTVNYNVAQLDKLGRLDPAVLNNLAAVTDQGHFVFLTRVLDESVLANIGQLSGPEIDSLLTRVGTSPPRLNTLGSLNVGEIRTFLAIGDDPLLVRFSNLSAGQIAAFRTLSTAELERFVQVSAADLPKFAAIGDAAALQRFATLAPDQVARFGGLSQPALNEWARVQLTTLNQFAGRDALTLGKLATGAGSAGLDRLAGLPAGFVQEFTLLDTAAMRRYLNLPPGQLAKFETMTAFNMQQLANRPPGELEALAATRTSAELLAEAGDTAANRAANRAAVLALDDPAINPATGRQRGHASEHRAGTDQPGVGGTMSPVERRLRTGVTEGGVPGPRPPEVSIFASNATQLEANNIGRAQLQRQIDAGNPVGPGLNGRHSFRQPLEGAGHSFRIVGHTVDPITGDLVGGTMVQRQVGNFIIVFEPKVPTPTTLSDYFIVTMFPE